MPEFVTIMIEDILVYHPKMKYKEKIIDSTFERVDGEKDHILVLSFINENGDKVLFEGVIMEKNGLAGVYQVKMLTSE